jgi:hypothetical protein
MIKKELTHMILAVSVKKQQIMDKIKNKKVWIKN